MKKFLIIFFLLVMADLSYCEDYDSVILKSFGIIVEEVEHGKIIIKKIDKLGPMGRYSFFRRGDIILSIDGSTTLIEIQNKNFSLTTEDEVEIEIYKNSSGRKRKFHINLKKSLPMPDFTRKKK